MSLTVRELTQLKKISAIANQMIAKAEANLAALALKAAEPARKTAKKNPAKSDTKAAKKAAPKASNAAAKEVAPKAVAKTAKKAAPKAAKVTKSAAPKASAQDGKRTRRTGEELVAFRQMLSDERKNGVPVAELSKQHGVSAAYIYQL